MNKFASFKELFWEFISRKISLSIILIYNLVTIVIIAAFYPLIPTLLNYPPNNEEVSIQLGTSNILQYIVIMSFSILIGSIIFVKAFKGIDNWKDLNINNKDDIKKIEAIRRKCINLPYIIFIGQIFIINIPLIPILFLVASLNKISYLAPFKILVMVFSFFSLAAVISHTFSKSLFKKILLRTYFGQGREGIRIGLQKKIFLQILPLFIIAIVYTALIGYSRLIDEKGDLIYNIYKSQLNESLSNVKDIKDSGQAFEILRGIKFQNSKYIYFVKTPDNKVITSDGSELGGYLSYFIDNPYDKDRIFDINAETQGIVESYKSSLGVWKVGVIFKVASGKALAYFLIGFVLLLVINIFVLYYFSKSQAGEISLVAESLNDIAEGEHVDLDRKIAVVSNDELADLVIAFNKIQEREKEHIKEIEEKHSVLIAQERLATLGHLIGGIAHNLRTPIMSISGAIEGLKDLIREYDESIDDNDVTKEDHHEIAKEMNVWIEKMRPYCAYMSDIITAVKGQAMQRTNERSLNFTLDELNKRIEILFEYELRKQHCKLSSVYNIDMHTKIHGDISDMVQILNNLILNAVDAYEGKGGNIELTVNGSERVIEFIVRDYGNGIPKDIQSKLFKEMITTKGSKGTGLGLYMSYSNIKARFNGKMRFESVEGKGTTFYIYIPLV